MSSWPPQGLNITSSIRVRKLKGPLPSLRAGALYCVPLRSVAVDYLLDHAAVVDVEVSGYRSLAAAFGVPGSDGVFQ